MDLYGIEQIEEQETNNKPTIEEVKKIVDSKRNKRSSSTSYTKEDRIKNLELAREKKRNTLIELNETQNKLIVKSQLKSEPNIDTKPIKVKVDDISISSKSNVINENNILNELQKLILTQNEILEKLNTKTSRQKKPKEAKPKEANRLLDLTINDKEINNIIENKDIKTNKEQTIILN
jgi:hypothetical protein